jgi:aspartate-semialdehyde dehydrogenase
MALLGATGSVGSAVVELLAREQAVDRLTLVARNRNLPRLPVV